MREMQQDITSQVWMAKIRKVDNSKTYVWPRETGVLIYSLLKHSLTQTLWKTSVTSSIIVKYTSYDPEILL